MKNVTLSVVAIVMAILVLSSCTNSSKQDNTTTSNKQAEQIQSSKLNGTYLCTEHWNDALIGDAKIIFGDDNKVSFSGMANTTYRVDGDSVFFDMHTYEMGFKIDGNTLRASGKAGNVAYSKK